jgi:ferritin-like metal-binding protein YciE
MSKSEQKVLQYLNEAHAAEVGLVRTMQAQILMAPRGSYRTALESHLRETRDHASRLERRMSELGREGQPLMAVLGLAESVVSQILALGKTPFDLIRGGGGEEKVLKAAKDACAAEALEIATYTALERLARSVHDEQTAELAASIRAEEQKMLERVLRAIPRLADAVVGAEVEGESTYELSETGAADLVGELGKSAKRGAAKVQSETRRAARGARKVPGVARVEGQVKGVVAGEQDLGISGYDKLNASEIVAKLPNLSQVELAKVESYERRNQARTTIQTRIDSLQAKEPWPGYDELNADEIRSVLAESDEERIGEVRSYERAHKNRAGVLEATNREHVSA